MRSSELIRWSGLVLILGLVLLVISSIIHPLGESGSFVLQPLWVPAHLLGSLGIQLMIFGFIGLYARHAENLGRLGLASFLMTIVGLILTAGSLFWFEGIIDPIVTAQDPAIAGQNGGLNGPILGSPTYLVPFLISGLAWIIGFLLFGVAALRANISPRWASWLLILPAVLSLVIGPIVLVVVPLTQGAGGGVISLIIVSIPLAIGLGRLGYALWLEKRPIT
jgi:hypothetical protein